MTSSQLTLQNLWQRGCKILGSQYAIMGGAMTWVSERNLVSAISNAGGFGVLACGAMTPDRLREEIQATRLQTQKPFGVNLILLHPQLENLIHVCIEEKVSHVVLAGGVPGKDTIASLKDVGICVIAFAPALSLAKRLIKFGIDALVIEGHEAGGHIGPVSTSVLAQEILPHVEEVPVFVAGGIARGDAIVSYLEMGAAGCQLGTRFVCAFESTAHPNFKKRFIESAAREAIVCSQLDSRLPVIPVRALLNKGTQRFMEFQKEMMDHLDQGKIDLKDAQIQVEHFWAGALRRAVVDGDVEEGSLMAGQSVGMLKAEESLQTIMEELIQQACHAIERQHSIRLR